MGEVAAESPAMDVEMSESPPVASHTAGFLLPGRTFSVEILHMIMPYVPKADLPALMRASHSMYDIASPFLYNSIVIPSSRFGQGPLLFPDSPSKRRALEHVRSMKVEYSVRLETHWNHHVQSPPLPNIQTVRIRRVPYCFDARCQLLNGLTPKTLILEDDIVSDLGKIDSLDSNAFPDSITRLIYLCPSPVHTFPPTRLDVPHVVPNLTETTFIFTPRHLWQIHDLSLQNQTHFFSDDRQFTNAVHLFVFHIFHSPNPVLLVGLETFPKESRTGDLASDATDEQVVEAFARDIKARIQKVYGQDMYFKADKLGIWEEAPELRKKEMRGKMDLFRAMSLRQYVEEELREEEVSWKEAQGWLQP